MKSFCPVHKYKYSPTPPVTDKFIQPSDALLQETPKSYGYYGGLSTFINYWISQLNMLYKASSEEPERKILTKSNELQDLHDIYTDRLLVDDSRYYIDLEKKKQIS